MKVIYKLALIIIIAAFCGACSKGAINTINKESNNAVNKESDNSKEGTSESSKKLYIGIKNNNLEQVIEALKDGADINKIQGISSEANPLKLALDDDFNKIAKYLVEHGADANYTDKTGVSLLMSQAYNSRVSFCEILIKHGAEIDKKVDKNGSLKGDTALEVALKGFRPEKEINETVDLLLKYGAKVRPETLKAALIGDSDNKKPRYEIVNRILKGLIKNGYRSELDPLLEAAILGDTSKMTELIKSKGIKKEQQQQILFYTAAFGNVDAIKLIEENGIDIKMEDRVKDSALAIASRFEKLDIMQYLVEKGASIEAKNQDDETPLIEAVRSNQYKSAKWLIERGANVEPYGDTIQRKDLFFEASLNGNVEMMKLLIAKGYPANEKSLARALTACIEKNYAEASKYLLSIGAGIDMKYNERSPLENACLKGKLEGVKFAVENVANINDTTLDGEPLSLAATYGNSEIVAYLIKNGANVNYVVIQESGIKTDSALMQAIMRGYFDIVKLIVENGAELEYQNELVDNNTALIVAAGRGSRNISEFLIQKGANLNYQNLKGKTALMTAVEHGQVDNVRVLLKYKADVNLKDKEGHTALDIAKTKADSSIVKLLENTK